MWRIISAGVLLAAVVSIALSGLLDVADNRLQAMRFALSKRNASGQVVLVQVDAHSLNMIGAWPWPRNVHAKIIDRLRQARARDIALDIDFSHAARDKKEDDALEAALARADGSVILPAFRQPLVSGDANSPIFVSRPLPQFSRYSWPAIVNVWPDPDGIVRRMERLSRLDGEMVASMAQLVAGGQANNRSHFSVDFSIDPATIPRLSAVDVLMGNTDLSVVAGKSVIFGATAIELGDRFAVPLHGIVAGAEFQVLAAETLLQNRPIISGDDRYVIGSLALVLLGIAICLVVPNWRRDVVVWPLVAIGIEVGALALFRYGAINLPSTQLHLLILCYLGWRGMGEIKLRQIVAQIARIERDNSEAMLGRVLEDSFDGIIIADAEGKVLSANRRAVWLLTKNVPIDRGADLVRLLDVRIADAITTAVRNALQGVSGLAETELSRYDDNDVQHLQLMVTRSVLGGEDDRRIVTLTFRDVTEQRMAADTIAHAAAEAQAASRAKSAFLATVSHELRTPLNAIIGFSDILKNEMFGKIGNDRYLDYAGHISESGMHLLRIVNDILDITRIEAGKIVLKDDTINLRALFDEMASTMPALPGGTARELATSVEPEDLVAIADAKVFKQILLNLLSNAVKFTDEGEGRIQMAACCDRDGMLRISVSDNGVGIDAQHLPHLAKPFYQVDGRLARQHEGSGLGLALVNGYVAAHGGRLAIESEPGAGTTVTLFLPAERARRQRNAA